MKEEFFKDYQALVQDTNRLKKSEANPFFKSKYVPLKEVLKEAKRLCKKNNFIFIQRPSVYSDKEEIQSTLITELIHISGESIKGEIKLVAKDKDDPQKLGGAITYMRRYSLSTMLGIEEEDDDGNKAAGNVAKNFSKPGTTKAPF
ncbi:MAG: ERF family protein [Parcubacteria group bacterium]|nr:ERF family protein [Parcubacteria group bacterium]